jgi:cytochrome c-type biogenesis protein CcmH
MIIFWILAAGLMALAVLFVALPLLREPQEGSAQSQDNLNLQVFRQRLDELDADLAAGFLDQGQYESARRDLERELLSDLDGASTGAQGKAQSKPHQGRAPALALILAIALPTAAVFAYLELGNGEMIPRLEAAAAGAEGAPPGMAGADATAMASLETMAQGLAERLAKEPDNLDGWLMLGRTWFAVNQPAKALDAMEHAYKLAPRQAGAMLAYAEALAANAGNRLAGRPAELIQAALKIEPGNVNARWLGGMVDYQNDRFADAAKTWEGILPGLDPAGEETAQLRQMIADARARGGLPTPTGQPLVPAQSGQPPAAATATDSGAADSGAARAAQAAIRVKVSLAPALAASAAPQDTLFVFARAAEGPPMPLAVQRLKAADLPTAVTLDDSMAMMPSMRLSAFPKVVVGARISKSGQATPAAGDLEGQTGPVAVAGAPEVSVTIDTTRP